MFLFVIVMSEIITVKPDARAVLRDSVGDIISEITEVICADSEFAQICVDIIQFALNMTDSYEIGTSLNICISDVHHFLFNFMHSLSNASRR